MFRPIIITSLILLLPFSLEAQEVISGLQSNYKVSLKAVSKSAKGITADTLQLPFFDDFSYDSSYPDPVKWDDDNVFINNTFSDKQITRGVATFDIIDNRGMLYEISTPYGFEADKLTSVPINLQYSPASDIYLSFVYEPGGLSDSPEPNDSLSVQFFSPSEDLWYSVWSVKGSENAGFKNVIIPVNNARYLQNGFRFRFINYGSLPRNIMDPSMIGNCDIWNIDYVLLNAGRNPGDTIYNDVAFTKPVRSVLRNYESIPWKQFRAAVFLEMGLTVPVTYRNNDVIIRNVTRDFTITDVYLNNVVNSFTGGAQNTLPGSDVLYNANLIYTFSSAVPDSALFLIKSSLKTDEFDPKSNDTIIYYQKFGDYFAYDDGSSEGGYGINGLGSRNAMFAHRFTTYITDTLRAVDICFNDSYMDANRRAFDLMIWDENNGLPGNILYKREEVIVERKGSVGSFYRYTLPDGVPVEGDFFIGWKQRSETFLNAGFDINTPHEGKQFFWLNGTWTQSQVDGTVMIRAVTGKPIITGIYDQPAEEKHNLQIWPNPATDHITISLAERPYSSGTFISVIDISGHEVMRVPYSEVIDISKLKQGMYIVITHINGRRTGTKRFVKSR